MTIREYFAELSSIWDELAMLEPKWSGEAIEIRHKQLEDDRFFNFLNRLRPEIEQIRSFLVSSFTSPSLEDVITKLSGEETRMGICKQSPSVLAMPTNQEESDGVNAVSRPKNNLRTYKPPYFKNQNQGSNGGQGGRRDYSKIVSLLQGTEIHQTSLSQMEEIIGYGNHIPTTKIRRYIYFHKWSSL